VRELVAPQQQAQAPERRPQALPRVLVRVRSVPGQPRTPSQASAPGPPPAPEGPCQRTAESAHPVRCWVVVAAPDVRRPTGPPGPRLQRVGPDAAPVPGFLSRWTAPRRSTPAQPQRPQQPLARPPLAQAPERAQAPRSARPRPGCSSAACATPPPPPAGPRASRAFCTQIADGTSWDWVDSAIAGPPRRACHASQCWRDSSVSKSKMATSAASSLEGAKLLRPVLEKKKSSTAWVRGGRDRRTTFNRVCSLVASTDYRLKVIDRSAGVSARNAAQRLKTTPKAARRGVPRACRPFRPCLHRPDCAGRWPATHG